MTGSPTSPSTGSDAPGASTSPMRAPQLRAWCRAGLVALGDARAEIDALNVYPVPGRRHRHEPVPHGGVRGRGARPRVRRRDAELAATARGVAHGALLGARGNSGVILSQLLPRPSPRCSPTRRRDPAPSCVAARAARGRRRRLRRGRRNRSRAPSSGRSAPPPRPRQPSRPTTWSPSRSPRPTARRRRSPVPRPARGAAPRRRRRRRRARAAVVLLDALVGIVTGRRAATTAPAAGSPRRCPTVARRRGGRSRAARRTR